MREKGLRALHAYCTRGWSVGKSAILVPRLLKRQFTVTRPSKAWVTDTAYIRTWKGWLYLAVVMDLLSRKIVGWCARPAIHRELVLDAVLMAMRRRRPRGMIMHSDQGTQFGDDVCIDAVLPLEPPRAEDEPQGNCLVKVVVESFCGSLKKERIKKHVYKNRGLAAADVVTMAHCAD